MNIKARKQRGHASCVVPVTMNKMRAKALLSEVSIDLRKCSFTQLPHRANIRNDKDLWEKMSRLKNETIKHELTGNAYIAPDLPPSKSSNQSIIKIIKPVEVQRCIVKCCPLGYLTTDEEAKLGRKFYEIPFY